MENKNKFFRISEKQFTTDFASYTNSNSNLYDESVNYNNIKLPKRATTGSAGYDFYSPVNFILAPGKSIKIPTGIRVRLNSDNVLLIFPRSSLGFKYKLKIDNTVGVIDSDYFNSDNEGHIWVSMTNMSSDKTLKINKGDAICQGLILTYGKVVDDDTDGIRNGGMGSTNNKS